MGVRTLREPPLRVPTTFSLVPVRLLVEVEVTVLDPSLLVGVASEVDRGRLVLAIVPQRERVFGFRLV